MPFFYSGVNTTPENERVKALSEACLDRSYFFENFRIDIEKEIKLLRTTTATLAATITPELADDKTLSWASEDESIAIVTQEGVVKGVNVGTTNITATAKDGSGVSATCKVTVNPVTINLSTNTINLQKGSEYVEQTATVLPENYEHKDVVWTTSGNGVASVDKD